MGLKQELVNALDFVVKYIYVIANEKKKGDDLITYGNNVPIIGVRNYKMKSANGIEHEQEHSLDYAAPDNINYNRELSANNTILYHDERLKDDYRAFTDKVLEDERAKGNEVKNPCWNDSKTASTAVVSIFIGMSTEMYQSMTKEEREQYFKDSFDYVKDTLYPGAIIADARIHRDEGFKDEDGKWQRGQDHLQVTVFPTYRTIDKETGKETVEIKTSKFEWDMVNRNFEKTKAEREEIGRKYNKPARPNFGHDMQREFVSYTREKQRDKGRDIAERSKEYSARKNMEPREFKAWKDNNRKLEKEREKLQKEKNELKEREDKQFNKAIEQDRKSRALDKQEKELSEARQTLNKDVKTVAAERDRVEGVKAKFEANRDVVEQVRQTADRLKEIDNKYTVMEVPEPAGRNIHKGYYTREQMEDMTKAVNKEREQTKNIEKYREVSSLDERLQQASKKANENIKDKTIDRLQEENKRLQKFEKDHEFVTWLERNYDIRDIQKDYEKEHKEHERTREHDRNNPQR